MARVQVGYDPRAEALQTVAAPNIQTEQARNDPNSLKAVQLAAAFASPTTQAALSTLQQKQNIKDQVDGEAAARSMTNEELEKQIKEGTILGVQSPVRVAAMRHVYGENLASGVEMDVLSKAQRGQFATWEEAQAYLREQQKGALENQDEYTKAGFGKSMASVTNRLQALTLQSMNQKAVEFADAQANQRMRVTLEKAKSGEIPSEQGPKALGDSYRDAVKMKLLTTPQQRTAALTSTLTDLAKSGRVDLLEGFLKEKLDAGQTIEDVVGTGVAAQYRAAAEGAMAKKLKEEGQARLLAEAERGHAEVSSAVDLAVSSGTFARNKDRIAEAKVLNPSSGMMEKIGEKKAGEMADEVIRRQIQSENLPMNKQVMLWATNDRLNPDWSNKIQAFNLASLGWESKDKKIGTLNPQSKEAIATYLDIAKTSQEQADAYAGKDNAKIFRRIQNAMRNGSPDVDAAASLIYEGMNSGISTDDYSIKKNQADKIVDSVVNPHFWSPSYRWASGLWGGNKDLNLTQIKSDAMEMVGDLVRSGKVEPEKAVEQVMTYLADPAVTTVINNTIYYNKDLPSVPDGQNRSEWMTKFIKQKAARDYGGDAPTKPFFEGIKTPLDVAEGVMRMGGSLAPVTEKPEDKVSRIGDQIRLAPNVYGGYDAWIGGVPATDKNQNRIVYSKKEIETWIGTNIETEQRDANTKRNAEMSYEGWRTKVYQDWTESNAAKPAAQQQPGSGMAAMKYITSKGAFEYLKQNNMLDKPVDEIVDFMKKKGK
jgi:hypothetical protein